MSIKVFQTNANGKIEFTRCELEKLLNETYDEGYRAGENHAKGQYWTPNWRTLTGDSINNKATATNTTNITSAINDLKCATEISDTNGVKAIITTCINNEPPRTYTIDLSKNSDFDSMAKVIEDFLYGHPKQSARGERTDPFTSLAKELNGV